MDAKGDKVEAPLFKRVFAGNGVPADSGGMHAVLISEDGKVYTTGINNKYQLCLGKKFDYEDKDYDGFVDLFHEVPGMSNAKTAAVGDEFTLILTDDNEVYGCGSNEVGQIGQGVDVEYSQGPVQIDGLGNINDMAVGLRFAIFLDSKKGKLWATGSNLYGQQCFFDEGSPTNEVKEVSLFLWNTYTPCS